MTDLIAAHHVVTLVGPGGSGKTRLALEVSRIVGEAGFIDLSAVREPAAVAALVSGALQEPDGRLALLVIDNCEQVVAATRDQVEGVLAAHPDITVLATSREPLGVEGEQVFRVPPLSAPASIELFVDRATLGSHAFRLDPDNEVVVSEIARRLEGMPLGIELAASWVPVMGVAGILDRMAERLDLFAGSPHARADRHRSLRAAIEWSSELLEPDERKLWWRLAVFAPLFDLAAVEAVCQGDGISARRVPELVRRLVERSVVQTQTDHGRVRYRLLDTVRDFCVEHLQATGETDGLAEAHARYYVDLAEEGFTHRDGELLIPWAERLTADHPNLRTALEWLFEHDRKAAVQLAGAMGWVWGARELLHEGRRLLEAALNGSQPDTWFVARAHRACGLLALEQGDVAAARTHLTHALTVFEAQKDAAGQAIVLARLGMIDKDRNGLERAVELAEASGERTALIVSLANLGALDLARGAPRSARLRYEQAAAQCRNMGHARWLPDVLEGLAQAQLGEKDASAARATIAEALTLASKSGLSAMLPSLLETAAEVAAASAAHERSLRLAGAAAGLRRSSAAAPHEWPEKLKDAIADSRRKVPGAADALLADGNGLTAEEAVTLALDEADARLSPAGVAISRRQAQVATLVAEGLTNAQIASRLHISERTAEWHVEELRNRLGYSSRAQVAAWAARQGLTSR